ncbi:MAG: hypothetical protein KDD68_20205 [Bdellovibrionales bacterium]|nr:hypothetical protein [Bdellovibrionales bacterium]
MTANQFKRLSLLVVLTGLLAFYQNFDFGIGFDDDKGWVDIDGSAVNGGTGDIGVGVVGSNFDSTTPAIAQGLLSAFLGLGTPTSSVQSVTQQSVEFNEITPQMGQAVVDTMSLVNSILDRERELNREINTYDDFVSQFGQKGLQDITDVNTTMDRLGIDFEVTFNELTGKYRLKYGQRFPRLTLHADSKALAASLRKQYQSSHIPCGISRIGLTGVKIVISTNARSSVYLPSADTIVLSLDDYNTYGIAVLDHELLHAGLSKLKKAKLINKRFHRISNFNIEFFDNFNGYIGNGRNSFGHLGYGKQEAFAWGWSYAKLKGRFSTLNANQKSQVQSYLSVVDSNKVLSRTTSGKRIYIIDSDANAQDIRYFVSQFTSSSTPPRRVIAAVDSIARNALSRGCTPQTIRVGSQTIDLPRSFHQRKIQKILKLSQFNHNTDEFLTADIELVYQCMDGKWLALGPF